MAGATAYTGGRVMKYAYKAARSASETRLKWVYGKTGYRWAPSRPTPSRMARWKAACDQRPMPVCRSGVIFVA
ncbi:hypothetical protein D3C72_2392610 [compost metagenome]